MDFFNVLQSLFIGAYSAGSIYPPFPLLIYKFLLRFIPYDLAGQFPYVVRDSQSGEVIFIFYLLITLFSFFILINEIKKGLKFEKYFFIILISFSAPFLFQFERANIVFVALLLLMVFIFFKDSKNKFVRELAIISLALSGAIKFYPLLFSLLLFKDKRYKDILKLVSYSLGLFFLPLLAVGGVRQIPLIIRNFLYTSHETTAWGFGYEVNIQNMTRIIFGILGDFGKSPVILGRIISIVILVLGIISATVSNSKWKVISILSLLVILVPHISYEYTLIFMIIPLILFLDKKEKEKWDKFYLACFIILFITFPIDHGVNFLNEGFKLKQFLLITYGVLIRNVVASAMIISLIVEPLLKNRLDGIVQTLREKNIKFYFLIPLLIILVYNLSFFNKYIPITEGWFSTYAYLLNHGHFIYKDFYMFLTPLYTIIISTFTAIFGYDILSLRIFGIGIILLITFFLYKNLEVLFGGLIASFVTTVGVIYYQSGVAHITYDFTQFVTLFGLIQAYCLLRFIKLDNLKKLNVEKWIFLAGFFAGLTFLTKQSNGLMMTIFPLLGLILLSLKNNRGQILRIILYYASGFAIPVFITLLWLLLNGAFIPFKEQVFTDAVSAKGGFFPIFSNWIRETFTIDFIRRSVEILITLLLFGYFLNLFKKKKTETKTLDKVLILGGSFLVFVVLVLSIFLRIGFLNSHFRFAQMGISNLTVAAVDVSLIAVVLSFIYFNLNKPINKALTLLSFVSLGFIVGNGTSAGLSEAGAFLGFCIFVGLMLTYKSFYNLGKLFIILFCISLTFIYIEIKFERPYYWWNVSTSDIRVNQVKISDFPVVNGLYTSSENLKLINEVLSEISIHSKPNEAILTFPNIPLFYLLTNRMPPGKAIVYWFDFLPDSLAQKEASIIKKNPPKVIVYLDLGPGVWEAHEKLFRNGKPSGQRMIDHVIKQIIVSKKMHVSKRYLLQNGVALSVYTI